MLLFCSQRVRYPAVKHTTRVQTRDTEAATSTSPPPSYEAHPQGNTVAPPDYEDALNDAIVNPDVEDDTSVNCDDRAPLNP